MAASERWMPFCTLVNISVKTERACGKKMRKPEKKKTENVEIRQKHAKAVSVLRLLHL